MAGIAGIAGSAAEKVSKMLDMMSHRGKAGRSVFESDGVTMGVIWNEVEKESVEGHMADNTVGYENGPGHCARAQPEGGSFRLYRDELGVAPLYYGRDAEGRICFASEVKALISITSDIHEMPPGKILEWNEYRSHFLLRNVATTGDDPEKIANELRKHLDNAVAACIRSEDMGSWLSGGLDSSTICALAAGHMRKLKTFAAGIKGAPDLEYAREAALHIKSEHHEVIVTVDGMIKSLPEVIYHLESFDALLVRSSITNFLVAERASEYVSEVFSGEGGDELFAGYEYLKSIPEADLADELLNLTRSLHNTALQRVDRSASAFGTVAHVVFTDPEVVRYALTIPVKYKIVDRVEKWILRKAMEGALPDRVLKRPKAKFWEGAGVKELISNYADGQITDKSFYHERKLPDGGIINTKEELLYYRIFKDCFGRDIDLSWMGRTGRSPVT